MTKSAIVFAAVLVVVSAGVRASVVSIEQVGQKFSEKSLDLKAGDVLNFTNHDDVGHNITVVSDDDETSDLGLQKPGETFHYAFDKAGRFKIRCSIHPSMKMTINVK